MAHSLLEFAKALGAMAEADMLMHESMEKACEIVEKEAKRVIGTYDYGWPQLAESTQKDREAKGFSANDPLLRTGEMRDSIEHRVGLEFGNVVGIVGTDNPIAKYQELGTAKIPPRSFLGGAAMAKEHEVRAILGLGAYTALAAQLKP